MSNPEASTLKGIQPEELHILMQDLCFREEAQLIDVREPDEISIAAIGGFKPYPLSQFGQWAPTITEDLEPAKDTYLLCHHGVRSMQAAMWLKSQGFKRLFNVVGGIHAYATRVDESITKY
ncbi:hypothetical protein O6H91_04G028700 [Diphasiastrum complanatum]|uniref:Uncharacterized protein n=1 Tax=Diphasiastrum complanatum TaxID=34168 RepID=A0ACC2DVC1_DIPCM|nr:hypothetical protein O6H91_04G028700 [Diphasiastrum complanatum]